MQKWIWRGIIVIVLLFLGLGLYRFFFDSFLSLKSDVLEDVGPLKLEVSLLDEEEGLVSLRSDFFLYQAYSRDVFRSSSLFPLTLDLCFYSSSSLREKISLPCQSRLFSNPDEFQPMLAFEQILYLPNDEREFSFWAEIRVESSSSVFTPISSLQEFLRWTPSSRLKLLDRHPVSPGERIIGQDTFFVESRFSEVLFSFDGTPFQPMLVIEPKKDSFFRMVDDVSPSFYQWIVLVPQHKKPSQVCLDLFSRNQCYFLDENKPSVSVSLCGNAIVEGGEECDDGNFVESDGCTSKCIVNNSYSPSPIYPETRVSIHPENGVYSLYAGFEAAERVSVDVQQIFIRFRGDTASFLSQERIDGLPFLHFFLPSGSTGILEFVYLLHGEERIFHTSAVDLSGEVPLLNELKASAGEDPLGSGETLESLQVKWLGSSKTSVDEQRQFAYDLSGVGSFETRMVLQSTFSEPLKVTIQFVAEEISFTHTLPASASDEIPLNIPRLSYGDHQILVTALFADGQRTADLVLPFHYEKPPVWSGFAWWQVIAIGILLMLGFSYMSFRMMFLMKRQINA